MEENTATPNKKQKRTKYDGTMNTMHTADPLSLLPEDLVQHILFFLPPRDVARTSILSKSWRIFWNSLPTQNFTLSYYHDDRREDSEATSKFIKFVDDSLQKLRGQIAKIKSFCLFISNYQQNLCSCMDDWIGLVTKNCIEELDICIFVISAEGVKRSVLPQATFLAKSLSVLRLQGFTLEDSLLRGDMMLPCLKILSLSHVHLSELMTEKLLSSCPSLEEFSLLTSRVVNLYVPNLPKLKKVEADVFNKIQIEALNLQILDCTCILSELELNKLHCNNLKELRLSSPITNRWIQELFDKFHFLETLHLKSLKRCQWAFISTHKLKRLSVNLDIYHPEVLHIDAPNLKSYTYQGDIVPSSFHMNTSGLQFAEIKMTATSDLDISWFLKLNKYLGMFHKHDVLALVIHSDVITFNPEEWTDIYTPQPCNLDRIKIIHISLTIFSNYSALLDGLLCCALPRTLQVKYGSGCNNKLIKDFHQQGRIQQCSFNCNFLCWRHILKDVKIKTQSYSGTEAEVVEQKRVFESLQNLEYGEQVIFEFTW
ncbi:hypothetical protein GH714_035850 [Hevea brasiliensis]|uniref:F-box domain-containing protein n=1 Tax=Hevea brasiliensis TaxID=3981 RepID=A0A6A6NCP2_HEVBR|nr:hypothetical protein GH714_035850 [Hevea brasiliensis]